MIFNFIVCVLFNIAIAERLFLPLFLINISSKAVKDALDFNSFYAFIEDPNFRGLLLLLLIAEVVIFCVPIANSILDAIFLIPTAIADYGIFDALFPEANTFALLVTILISLGFFFFSAFTRAGTNAATAGIGSFSVCIVEVLTSAFFSGLAIGLLNWF